MTNKIKVAVLVENHPYDVINFQKMFESFEDCECYIQPLDLFVRDDDNKSNYGTVVYYNMNNPIPKVGSAIDKYMKETAGSTAQGMIFMHHALLSFQRWELFTDICGLRSRGEDETFKYTQNQSVNIKIFRDPACGCPATGGTGTAAGAAGNLHPITAGAGDFTIVDETYILGEPDEPGNQILLTTDNETSMKKIGWVRQYKNSRIFCIASGHDNRVYADPNYRQILHNAILWTSGR